MDLLRQELHKAQTKLKQAEDEIKHLNTQNNILQVKVEKLEKTLERLQRNPYMTYGDLKREEQEKNSSQMDLERDTPLVKERTSERINWEVEQHRKEIEKNLRQVEEDKIARKKAEEELEKVMIEKYGKNYKKKTFADEAKKICHLLKTAYPLNSYGGKEKMKNYYKLLRKIIANIASNPKEVKFRSVNSKGEAFSNNILGVDGGLRILEIIGFQLIEDRVVMENEPNAENLNAVLEVLDTEFAAVAN
jgi:chromosome segregation ATPase